MNNRQSNELGVYLRQQREAKGVSTRQLASEVGVDMAQIIRLEQGSVASPRADVLGRVAECLDVPVADVLTLAGYPTTKALPSLRPYMRATYRELPPEAVDEIEAFIKEIARQHVAEGPSGDEDEH